MGSWETFVNAKLLHLVETEFFFSQRAREKVFFGMSIFDITFSATHRVGQLYNHRGHQCYAESWASVIGFFLLRL